MVYYHDDVARVLHTLPAALVLGLPLLLQLFQAEGSAGKGKRKPRGRKAGGPSHATSGPLAAAYRALAEATGRTLCGILLAVGLPALLGAGRTLASGQLTFGPVLGHELVVKPRASGYT